MLSIFPSHSSHTYRHRVAQAGFTLMEIMIVMVIIGVLSTIGVGSYRSTQQKSRDARRKSDLKNIASALEVYYNDKSKYPDDGSDSGKIYGCGTKSTNDTGKTVCEWGEAFEETVTGVTARTIYMVKLPEDPRSTYTYYYYTDGSRKIFHLYAYLENDLDTDINAEDSGYDCGAYECNYVVTSTNTSL
ncbi:MAG TPA: prepilin-type N-terminal cleavage/methylation domain-containing protein [Vitreimonas sp.]|nr:prepilin-type N-terminal cleavage/methylation domain-containing protein [Vitreimonas sp.]